MQAAAAGGAGLAGVVVGPQSRDPGQTEPGLHIGPLARSPPRRAGAEHAGVHELPEAYAEARAALDGIGAAGVVVALPLLTSFDYLVLRDDETARRLVRPQVARFVAEDAAAGGTLIATLSAYAACDLNAKTAAKQLHVHVNTAYYRLERIAERTG